VSAPHARRRTGTRALATLALTVALSAGAPPLGAQPPGQPSPAGPTVVDPAPEPDPAGPDPDPSTTTTIPTPAGPVVADPRVSPRLWAVPVDSVDYREALDRYRALDARLVEARSTFAEAQATLERLAPAEARLTAELIGLERRREKVADRLDSLRNGVRALAVAQYVRGGIAGPVDPGFDLAAVTDRRRGRVLVDTANEARLATVRSLTELLGDLDAARDATTAEREEIRRRITGAEVTRTEATRVAEETKAELVALTERVANARLEAPVAGLDMAYVVLDAYVKAADVLAAEAPGCRIRWQILAAVGRTESTHGTEGGARVLGSGAVTRPIIGIPLDGTNGTMAIPDTDGGALDRDPVWDRAVGPMQFIPASWRAYGRDGNLDGVADPQNVYDAALAAAGYLCRVQPLEGNDALRRAFLLYNNSGVYADVVLERTRAYDAALALPPGEPIVLPPGPPPVLPPPLPPE
jgi:membrane-bound lytic murein transglycosylase B